MPSTTTKGIPIPLDADPMSDQALVIRNGMAKVDALLPTIGNNTVSGTALAAGALLAVSVNFGFTWTTAPSAVIVYISGFVASSSGIVVKGVTAISTTAFTVSLLNAGAGAATWTALPIKWVAIP